MSWVVWFVIALFGTFAGVLLYADTMEAIRRKKEG
jgi:hypothetical protein